MQRLLIAALLAACGSTAPRPAASPTPAAATDDDVVCENQIQPGGMSKRVCHRQPADRRAAQQADSDMTCQNEVRTGTNLEKKICRSQAEKAVDKKVVEDLYLDPSSRPKFERPR